MLQKSASHSSFLLACPKKQKHDPVLASPVLLAQAVTSAPTVPDNCCKSQTATRRLTLTDAGRSYVAACKRILEDIGEAKRAARANTLRREAI